LIEQGGDPDSSDVNGDWERGRAINRRRLTLGIKSLREFVEASGVSRKAITAAEDGHGSKATYERLEAWLDRMEEEMGMDVPSEPPTPVIDQMEVVIEGRDVTVTVKAPITDPDALEEMAARIMRRIWSEQ
jgi:hypothetical protein